MLAHASKLSARVDRVQPANACEYACQGRELLRKWLQVLVGGGTAATEHGF